MCIAGLGEQDPSEASSPLRLTACSSTVPESAGRQPPGSSDGCWLMERKILEGRSHLRIKSFNPWDVLCMLSWSIISFGKIWIFNAQVFNLLGWFLPHPLGILFLYILLNSKWSVTRFWMLLIFHHLLRLFSGLTSSTLGHVYCDPQRRLYSSFEWSVLCVSNISAWLMLFQCCISLLDGSN